MAKTNNKNTDENRSKSESINKRNPKIGKATKTVSSQPFTTKAKPSIPTKPVPTRPAAIKRTVKMEVNIKKEESNKNA